MDASTPASAPTPAPTQAAPEPITTWPGAFALWGPSKQAVWFNLNTLLTLFVLNIIPNVLQQMFKAKKTVEFFGTATTTTVDTPLSSLFGLIAFVLGLILTTAIAYTLLSGARAKKVELAEAFNVGKTFAIRSFVLGLLVGLTVFGGIILLVVPGIYFALRLMLAPYYLFDKNMTAMDAYKASWAATSNHMGKLLGILGVIVLMALLFIIPILGWIAGFYLIFCFSGATALVYEFIQKQTPAAPAPTPAA